MLSGSVDSCFWKMELVAVSNCRSPFHDSAVTHLYHYHHRHGPRASSPFGYLQKLFLEVARPMTSPALTTMAFPVTVFGSLNYLKDLGLFWLQLKLCLKFFLIQLLSLLLLLW